MAIMVDPDPPRPPQLVEEVLETGHIPDELVEALLGRFRTVREDGGPLLIEKRTGQGLHSLLGHLASGIDPVPGFVGLTLLGIDWYRKVHLLHSLLSVLFGLYSMTWQIFA